MTNIVTGRVHHFKLTVSDQNRARDFYSGVLNFKVLADYGTTYLLSNGSVNLAVGLAPDPSRASVGDRFDENRVGLDHICLTVPALADLEAAVKMFDERGISHGEIEDAGGTGYLLTFRDPDNIQVELGAPKV